ncbi:hypothetical protein ACROYT_G031843 [Oculina patagonica]
MFCARRAVRIFGRRGRSVALRTSICELHSQIHRRTVLLWSARDSSRFRHVLSSNLPKCGFRWFSSEGLPSHTKVLLPALSPTMEMGTIVSWDKQEGDELSEGDLLAQIETDKATMEFETPEEGFLAKILIPAGSKDKHQPQRSLLLLQLHLLPPPPAASAPPPPQHVFAAPPPPPPAAPGGRVFASPLAKKIAQEKGVELSSLQGSGPGGRIVAEDVSDARPAVAAAAPTPVYAPGAEFTDIPLTNVRKVIARRLLESKQTIPHYYLSVDIRVDDLLE